MDPLKNRLEKKVAVIILNYNGSSKNIDCLKGIFNQTHRPFTVIFVDNNSSDNSISLVQEFCNANTIKSILLNETQLGDRKEYSEQLIIVKKDQNKGYSNGNNTGLQLAKKNIGDVSNILILNNDVILPAHYIENQINQYYLLKELYQTTKIVLGSPEYSNNGKRAHHGVHYLNLLSGLVFEYPIPPYYKYIVGSSVFLDNDPPCLDEEYFLYFDDVEYSKILQSGKYRFGVKKNNYYFHDQGFSTKRLDNLTAITYSSMKIFYRKYYARYIPFVFAFRYILNILKGRFSHNKLLYDNFYKQP